MRNLLQQHSNGGYTTPISHSLLDNACTNFSDLSSIHTMRSCLMNTLLLLTTFLVASEGLNLFTSPRISQHSRVAQRNLPNARSFSLNAQKKVQIVEKPAPAKSFFDAITTPVLAGTIGVTAFCFQIFGIFPWHGRISSGFEAVEVFGSI